MGNNSRKVRVGQLWGHLKVIAGPFPKTGQTRKWLCLCLAENCRIPGICRNETWVRNGNLLSGNSKRCRPCGQSSATERTSATRRAMAEKSLPTGTCVGNRTVIGGVLERGRGRLYRLCRCNLCGDEMEVRQHLILGGLSKSCNSCALGRLKARISIDGVSYTNKEVAEALKMSPMTISRWLAQGLTGADMLKRAAEGMRQRNLGSARYDYSKKRKLLV